MGALDIRILTWLS